MATVSADRAAATFPIPKPGGGGAVAFHYGVYEIASALSKNDIVEFCRLPACQVIDGFLRGDDLDTGTEALEVDVGHAANGTESADADAFLNSGVLSGDGVAELAPDAQIHARFGNVLKDGPYSLSAETTCQGVVTAAAASGGTGTLWAGFYYIESA